jgi:hypothetical protein
MSGVSSALGEDFLELLTDLAHRTFFAWANDAMRYDDYLFRSVVIASMNMMSNAVNAWWSIVFYSATYAPYFTVST